MAAAADAPTVDPSAASRSGAAGPGDVAALVLLWARDEPARVGEVALIPRRRVIGRGEPRAEDPAPRAELVRQRPGGVEPTGPIASAGVSRIQLAVEPAGDGVRVRRLGRRGLRVSGRAVEDADARPGDTIEIEDQLLWLVTRRAPLWAPGPAAAAGFPFGAADPHGIVGESAAAWALRGAIAFVARVPAHVLVHGPSGAGKELVARALHAASARADRPLVARNAATLPEGLIDAELFGNVRGYPNPGMPERAGLVGEADGSTLLLDEIGELPPALQAHLLRLLDRDGEYQRLGDARVRRADLRLIAATNRAPDQLKHDLAARLTVRVAVPGLDARAEDVPLLVQAILGEVAATDPSLVARFALPGPAPRFRIASELVDALARHRWTTHVRELERLIWQAVADSPGDVVRVSPAVTAALAAAADAPAAAPPAATPPPPATDDDDATIDPGPDALRAALDAAGGSVTRAARALGLRNRYVLYRLLRKHGIAAP